MSTDVESVVARPSSRVSVTDGQFVDSVIHIMLKPGKPPTLVVTPETVEVYYTHHGGGGDEMKPHRLLWIAMFKREPGDTILIRMKQVNHPNKFPLAKLGIQSAFPGGTKQAAPLTLVIEHDQNAVETDLIALPTDEHGRINFKYDVEYVRNGKQIAYLDPGGNLIPDP
jgi:hypothetical protein